MGNLLKNMVGYDEDSLIIVLTEMGLLKEDKTPKLTIEGIKNGIYSIKSNNMNFGSDRPIAVIKRSDRIMRLDNISSNPDYILGFYNNLKNKKVYHPSTQFKILINQEKLPYLHSIFPYLVCPNYEEEFNSPDFKNKLGEYNIPWRTSFSGEREFIKSQILNLDNLPSLSRIFPQSNDLDFDENFGLALDSNFFGQMFYHDLHIP